MEYSKSMIGDMYLNFDRVDIESIEICNCQFLAYEVIGPNRRRCWLFLFSGA